MRISEYGMRNESFAHFGLGISTKSTLDYPLIFHPIPFAHAPGAKFSDFNSEIKPLIGH